MYIREVETEIEACAFCNLMCKHVCSVGTIVKYESTYPVGKAKIAYSILKGYSKFDESASRRMYLCNDCSRCKKWCITGISDCSRVVAASRADIVEQGLAPKSILSWGMNSQRFNNIYEVEHTDKFSKISDINNKRDGDILYFIGCSTAYYHPEIASSVIKILDILGVDYSILGSEEWCCGHPLYVAGFRTEAKRLAEHNKTIIESKGIKKILTSCPECYICLRDEYRQWKINLTQDVEYLTTYIAGLDDIKFTNKLKMKAAYHDPCYLSRKADIVEEPRRVLSSIPGMELVELGFNRCETYCCGWGGGLQVTYPAFAEEISRKVLNMALEIKAEALISSCPFCKQSFKRSAQGTNIIDIAEIIAESLG